MFQKRVSNLKPMFALSPVSEIPIDIRGDHHFLRIDESEHAQQYNHEQQEPSPLYLKIYRLMVYHQRTYARVQTHEHDNCDAD